MALYLRPCVTYIHVVKSNRQDCLLYRPSQTSKKSSTTFNKFITVNYFLFHIVTNSNFIGCFQQYSSSPVPACRVLVGCTTHTVPDTCPSSQHSYYVQIKSSHKQIDLSCTLYIAIAFSLPKNFKQTLRKNKNISFSYTIVDLVFLSDVQFYPLKLDLETGIENQQQMENKEIQIEVYYGNIIPERNAG